MKLTNIEKAIDLIRRKGFARSPEIADHLGIKVGAVMPSLVKPVEDGYLVTCRVEIPGKPSVTEYRLSSTVSESKVSWEDFKIATRNKLIERPLKPPQARPPRIPAEAAPMVDIPAPVVRAPVTERLVVTSSINRREETLGADIVFMVDSNGQLRMERDGRTTLFSKEHTCAMGDLLVATAPIWSHV